MANEAVLVDKMGEAINFEVADGVGIKKGSFLSLKDARKASGTIVTADKCAGIAKREKIAGDGRTQLALYQDGVFRVRASGAIPVGTEVQLSDDGAVNEVTASQEASGATIGRALETAATGENFHMRLRL